MSALNDGLGDLDRFTAQDFEDFDFSGYLNDTEELQAPIAPLPKSSEQNADIVDSTDGLPIISDETWENIINGNSLLAFDNDIAGPAAISTNDITKAPTPDVVGPSQGLNSSQFAPAAPINLLTQPHPVSEVSRTHSLDTLEPARQFIQDPATHIPTTSFDQGNFNQQDYMHAPTNPYGPPPGSATFSGIGTTYQYPMPYDPYLHGYAPAPLPYFQQPQGQYVPGASMHPPSAGVPAGPTMAIHGNVAPTASMLAPPTQMPPATTSQADKSGNRSDSDSGSPSPNLRSHKPAQPITTQKFFGEKPKVPQNKPWVRTNNSTLGKSSRTGKINHFKPEEMYERFPHPLDGSWTTRGGKEFAYNKFHELTRCSIPTHVLKEFIYQHPKTKDCRLTLYIQRSAADSKRRNPTSTLDKCRFADCPTRQFGTNGNIMVGHYRVAFDEFSYKYGHKAGERADPFIVAGYVHLYCLERFLDLPAICQLPHVKVEADGRQLSKEPNGRFAGALQGGEYQIAANFVQLCKSGQIWESKEWSNYPKHFDFRDGDNKRAVNPKPHYETLNYKMQVTKNRDRCARVRDSSSPSTVAVHCGDLEIYCGGRRGLYKTVADIPGYKFPAGASKTPTLPAILDADEDDESEEQDYVPRCKNPRLSTTTIAPAQKRKRAAAIEDEEDKRSPTAKKPSKKQKVSTVSFADVDEGVSDFELL